jgi:hypothetical protein
MFIALTLICGLNQGPLTPDGCGLANAKIPFRTKAECREANFTFKHNIESKLPEGAYIVDQKCVTLGRAT